MILQRIKWSVAAVATALVFTHAHGVHASSDSERPDEHAIKAGLIFNFFKFTTWPPAVREGQELTFCILGKDNFGRSLDTMVGKTVYGRKVALRRVSAADSLRGCGSLFIASSEGARLPEIVKSAENHGVLTISDTEGFAKRGSMINLYLEGGVVRFEINNDSAVKAGIRLSSKLLKLARRVQPDGAERK